MLVAHRADFYRTAHPTAAEALLIVEVSDTSQRPDRSGKLHAFRDPSGGRYRGESRRGRGEDVSRLAFPDLVLAVGDILG
jgi:hypothetical protein